MVFSFTTKCTKVAKLSACTHVLREPANQVYALDYALDGTRFATAAFTSSSRGSTPFHRLCLSSANSKLLKCPVTDVNTIVTRRPRTSYGNSQTLLYLDVPSRALARPFDSTREISFATDGFSATFNTRAPIAPRALWRCIALARYARAQAERVACQRGLVRGGAAPQTPRVGARVHGVAGDERRRRTLRSLFSVLAD